MAAADRHLLFGLIALQVGLIDQSQLVAAFQAWARDKARPLADHLVDRGGLDAFAQAAVEAMVALHLKTHDGRAEQSLASIRVRDSTLVSMAGLGDPDIEASLAFVGAAHDLTTNGDVDRTASHAFSSVTADGQRFRILRPHAQGGLGAVFLALDAELHREVALKQIQDSHADDPVSRQRFLLEAEITGGLEHPGIVPVYGLGTYSDGRPYYAMRFIRGVSLKEAIDWFHKRTNIKQLGPILAEGQVRGPAEVAVGSRDLELRKLLGHFTDVCNAIGYAHSRGVIHRDIKPANIIVGKHGETLLVDWGLAKPLGRVDPGSDDGERTMVPSSTSGSAETLPGSAIGTPAYMSPEQAAGDLERLGTRSDVYALGATLYYLLTGRPPFHGEDVGEMLGKVQRGDFDRPRQIDRAIDPPLEAVCLKAMALKREDRYATSRMMADDVERWMADEPVTAWREPLARRVRRWAKRNRTAVAGAVAALVAGVIGLAAVAGVQARVGAELAKAYAATRRALTETQTAKTQTEAALGQSERNLYVASLSLAQREWTDHHIIGVEQFLAQCPPGLRRWEWHYLDGLCRSGRGGLTDHEGAVLALAFSPDGRSLASAGNDRVVRLWDVPTWRPRLRLTGHGGAVDSLAFSPDGRRLVSGSYDGMVRLWNAADGQTLRELNGQSDEVFGVAFHPVRPEVAAGTGSAEKPGEPGEIKVWNTESGQPLRSHIGHRGAVISVAYSPDGQMLASSSEDQTIVLWSDRDGKPTQTFSLATAGAPAITGNRVLLLRDLQTGEVGRIHRYITTARQLGFSSDGKWLAAAVSDGTMRLWQVSTGKEVRSVAAHDGLAHALAFGPSGEVVASAGTDRVVKLWSVATGSDLGSYLGHRDEIRSLAYSPDGQWLASGDWEGAIKFWHPDQRQETHLFAGLNGTAFGVAFSPDSQTLATATGDLFQPAKPGEIKLWNLASRAELRTLRGHKGGVSGVAYSPRGDQLVSTSADGTARIWDVATGAVVRVLRGHKGVVFGAAWSPDGQAIASCSGQLLMPGAPGEVKLWDAETGAEHYTVRDHQALVCCLAFSPDGRWLASGSHDKTVRIRDAATGQVVRILAGIKHGASVLAYSPDGKWLAVGSGNALKPSVPSDVTIWTTESGALVHTLRAHAQMVSGVAFSPDGARLVTTSRDGTVRMWDVETWQQVCALRPGSLYVNSVAFSPDGTRLATGNWNATVNLWEAPGATTSREPVSHTLARD